MPLTRSQRASSRRLESDKPKLENGIKRRADGRTVLGNIGENARPNLINRKLFLNKNKNAKKYKTTLTKENSPRVSKPSDFTLVPLSKWRLNLKQSMIQDNNFYDHESTVANSQFEAADFTMGIFEYMKWREEKYEMIPYFNKNYTAQTQFGPDDRRTLVDWMVEFQEIQETTHETLYLAVRLCDYYFSRNHVDREKLQLYAFAGFLLASKFEERWPPTFDDMIYLSEDSYKREDFVTAEMEMLKCLGYDINLPISYRYLRRFAKVIGMDMKSLTVARFYLELTLQEYEFVFEKTFHVAAACLWVAMYSIGYESSNRTLGDRLDYRKKYWSDLLTFYSGIHEWEIINIAKRIAKVVSKIQYDCRNIIINAENDEATEDSTGPGCQVIFKKYASQTFFQVAKLKVIPPLDINFHIRRSYSEKIDFEAIIETSNKMHSSECETKLNKMTLRSGQTPNPENPKLQNKIEPDSRLNEQLLVNSSLNSPGSLYLSCSSQKLKLDDGDLFREVEKESQNLVYDSDFEK